MKILMLTICLTVFLFVGCGQQYQQQQETTATPTPTIEAKIAQESAAVESAVEAINAPELETAAQTNKPLTVININAPVPPNAYPNQKLTSGDILTAATVKKICVIGYSSTVRNVPQATKDAVYKEYGILTHKTGEYEIDHLIPLELGGSNSIKNLWAESYTAPNWNAHSKDDFENKLRSLVCAGKLPLADAQRQISTDWIAGYKKYVSGSSGG